MPEGLLGATTITQVGLVVRDIEAAARAWSEVLGLPVPEIIVTDPVERAHTLYHGRSTPARAKLAFFQLGQVSLELIEPIDQPSTWNDQLVDHGASLHHIAFEVNGMAQVQAALTANGMPTAQTGDYEGGRYAYVDGGERLGAVIELLEND
jgi:catechol 2,3-dioxygenase-like lactoylglutathione lyase family enzyme